MNAGFFLCGQIYPQSQLQKGKHNFALLELAFFRQKRKPAKGSAEDKNRRQPLDDGGSAENDNTANYDILDFVLCSLSQILRDHHNKATSNQHHNGQRDQKRGHCR